MRPSLNSSGRGPAHRRRAPAPRNGARRRAPVMSTPLFPRRPDGSVPAMASATTPRAEIPEEDLPEMMALIDESDSVELKLTVPESDQRRRSSTWGSTRCRRRCAWCTSSTPRTSSSNRAGVVVRARRVQKKGDDSVVKLRPVVPGPAPRQGAQVGELLRGGRRDAGRLRVLGLDEARAPGADGAARRRPATARCASSSPRSSGGSTSDHAPAGVGAGRPDPAGPDLRAQAQVLAGAVRAPHGRRAVALPGLEPRARAVDQVRAGRGVPGGRRGARACSRRRASASPASSRPRPARRWTTSPPQLR